MAVTNHPGPPISGELIEAIRAFPAQREVEHCGARFVVPAFDFYADCPLCCARIKLRGYSANGEVEDLFDAIFEWMNQPEAREIARRRQVALIDEE